MLIDYLKFEKEEFKDLLIIVLVLAFLFTLTFLRFSVERETFYSVYLMFFLFLFLLFSLRLLFMKFLAYRNGFEIKFRVTYFNQYFIRNYDKLSYTTDSTQKFVGIENPKKFEGILMPFISLILYILTLGLLIFPSLWNYKIKKIPHKFLGTKNFLESQVFFDISNYRYSKVLFGGFIFYFIFGLFMKSFANILGFNFYNWFTYTLFWIAIFTMIPILGTEGWEFFNRGKYAWINAFTILVLGMLALLVFKSIFYVLIITVISFFMIFILILWKRLM